MTPDIQEKIAAAKARIEKAKESLAKLEEQATRPPSRRWRSAAQLAELADLDDQLKLRYGAGLSGLGEAVRKARKEGVVMTTDAALELKTGAPTTTSALAVEPDENDEGGVSVSVNPTSPPPAPSEALKEPEFDDNDEPPAEPYVDPIPTPAAPADDDAMPW